MKYDAGSSGLHESWPRIRKSRCYLILCVLFYSISIAIGQEFYLSVDQAFWGFNKVSYDALAIVFIFFLVVIPSVVLPLTLCRPSSIFLYSLMFFVYVPAVVIAVLNHDDSLVRYFWLLSGFCFGMVFCCVVSRSVRQGADALIGKAPSRGVVLINIIGALVCFIALYSTYGDILAFSGLSDIYSQREKGAATSLLIGYCQVYLAYVFAPVLFVCGVLYKRFFSLVLAVVAFIFVYMITAERTVILLPFVLLVMCLVFRVRGGGISNVYYLFLGGSFLILLISFLFKYSSVVNQLGVYIFTRTIAIPGLFVSQYYDLFSQQGYTYWSHVSVLGRLIDIPAAYVADEKWPALGKILAERVLGIQSQSNANFVATDGVAAAGAVGVVVICMAYAVWLLVLDWAARGWSKVFLFSALFPLAFVSTNGSLFTMLTSFGGFYWILMLLIDKYRFHFGLRKELAA
ncbi:hypothetical protein [Pseudomonas sp. NFIX28]|uniref:hypothetical protein n=1 Tax=Pseudomonas sp. NFIX28 TaxID=1566235 RepID=UPI0021155F17|nr:hypothetical protein [Pseudomonas sp. NFIX28]